MSDPWDVRGDGRFYIWTVHTEVQEVTLWDVPCPTYNFATGTSSTYLVMNASLVLYHKDGWYTFRKDRSGGLWLEQLVRARLVREEQILTSMNRGQCARLSEPALRALSLMV